MTSQLRVQQAARAVIGSLLVASCARHPVTFESAPPRGHIMTRPGTPGVVVAAPHGTSDSHTGEIASAIARRTGFGLVVATGFLLAGGDGRYQVNRPSEGRPGSNPLDDRATPAGQHVYAEWEQRVRAVAGERLRFYVEIHGNGRPESAGRIEIATVGVDPAHAIQLRTLLELTRDAHLRGRAGAPRLDVLIEPLDRLFYTATGAKRDGIFRIPERALHIELPRVARQDFRDLYTVILAEFLFEAASLRSIR